ncbi:VCBS repeat-containing protein [Telmatobacter sp. DSM 110680]|uniref:VCBS repeat-containing protein n=1 Tax=Telmatobacter sp. DSM 110680 TaxID=3036704 RepID=A0AAU7DHF4_9BACT
MTTCSPNFPPGSNPNNTVLLNQSNGTFKAVEDTAIDNSAVPVLSVDMNGDGYSDLILHQAYGSPIIGVQLSNGDGTFKAPVYYTPTTVNETSVFLAAAAGDFNGDGKTDVAIVTLTPPTLPGLANTNTLTIFLNTGSGGLKQAASYALDATSSTDEPTLLVAGKLDANNETDLAVIHRGSNSAKVATYYATGGGSFITGTSFTVNGAIDAGVIGEFTTSGSADVALTTSKGIQVFLGSSSGSFTAAPVTGYPPTITNPTSLVVADFDKDGKMDLAALGGAQVLVFWGAGNGTFSSNSALSQSNSSSLIASDINGDGLADLAASDVSGVIHIFSNLGARNFRSAPATSNANAAGIVTADFNKDGKKDVAVVNTPTCSAPCNGSVTVVPGTGATYFAAGKKYNIGMHGAAIAAGDLNGDGFLDLVVTDATAGDNADTSVLMGTSGGGFASAKNYTLGSLSNVAYLVDMNGDGKLDLVEAGGVALGKGDGTFGPLIPFPDGIGFVSSTSGFNLYLGVGHFNAGSTPDVAVAYNTPQNGWEVFAMIGDGTGHFTATQLGGTDGVLQTVQGLTVGKLRTGGPDDIVVANSAAECCGADGGAVFFGEPVIFFGDGTGSFSDAASTSPQTDGAGVGGVVIADFNHDGLPDIGMVSADQFGVALGIDGFNFSTPQVFSSTSGPLLGSSPGPQNQGNLVVADFNGDGWPDVVTSNVYGITRLYDVPVPMVSPGSLTWDAGGSQKITIKNTVSSSQAIQIALAGVSMKSFAITSNTCGSTLAAGASCSVTIEYIPGQAGTPSASNTLWVRSNGAFIVQVQLSGMAE